MNNIQKLRKEKGWTQERLAKEISVSRSTIAMWENCNSNPDNESLLKLAKIFDTTTDTILGEYSPSDEIRHAKKVFAEWLKNTQIEFAELEKKSETSIATIKSWAEGFGNYFDNKLSVIADIMGCTVDFLIGRTSNINAVQIPVYGKVAAGIPISAIEDIVDYEEISEDMARHGEYIALQIKGDSMEPKISNGDVVIVKLQSDVSNGDTAIVLVNGDEATCKKIKKTPEGVMLISTNPNYEPLFYSKKQVEELPVRIIGKVVELRAKFG